MIIILVHFYNGYNVSCQSEYRWGGNWETGAFVGLLLVEFESVVA